MPDSPALGRSIAVAVGAVAVAVSGCSQHTSSRDQSYLSTVATTSATVIATTAAPQDTFLAWARSQPGQIGAMGVVGAARCQLGILREPGGIGLDPTEPSKRG